MDPVAAAVRLTLDRAEALVTGDLAELAAVTVPGSPARTADIRRALGERGASAAPVRMVVVSVARLAGDQHGPACGTARPAPGPPGLPGLPGRAAGTADGLGCARVRLVVRVTAGSGVDDRGTGDVTDPAEVPGVVLVLRTTPGGWRVSDVTEAH